MSLGTGDIRGALDRVLLALIDSAFALGVALPGRRYVTVGGAVYDCEQVSVSGMALGTGLVGAGDGGLTALVPCSPVWQITVEIAIVRCANERPGGPRGELPPAVGLIELDADAMSADAAVLVGAITMLAGDPFLGSPSIDVQFTQPQGGMVAVSATVTFNPFT